MSQNGRNNPGRASKGKDVGGQMASDFDVNHDGAPSAGLPIDEDGEPARRKPEAELHPFAPDRTIPNHDFNTGDVNDVAGRNPPVAEPDATIEVPVTKPKAQTP